ALLGTYIQRRLTSRAAYVTVSGKASAKTLFRLGRWRWPVFGLLCLYFFFAIILPFLGLLVVSFQPVWSPNISWEAFTLANYDEILFDSPRLWRSLRTSLLLAVIAATTVMLVAAGVTFLVSRTKVPGRALLDYIGMTS